MLGVSTAMSELVTARTGGHRGQVASGGHACQKLFRALLLRCDDGG